MECHAVRYLHFNRNLETAGISLNTECSNGDVRLMNGSDHTSTLRVGRVEICYNNSYWAVCDDQWDTFDAGVVCRELGEHSSSEVHERRMRL